MYGLCLSSPHSTMPKTAIDEIVLAACASCRVAAEHKEQHCFAIVPSAQGERIYYIIAQR